MKLPRWARVAWWIILVGSLTYVLLARLGPGFTASPTLFDVIVIAALAGLLLSPLFNEVDVFGFRLTAEVRELRSELFRQITDLKADIRNTIDVRVAPQIVFPPYPTPPKDEEIPDIEARVRKILNDAIRSYGVPEYFAAEDQLTPPPEAGYLFGVRYNLETALRRLYMQTVSSATEQRPVSFSRMVNDLVRAEILDPDLVYAIREVYSAASASMHGEEVTAQQMQFVRSNAPDLVRTLRTIQRQA